jgi:hypothetical protein
MNDEQWDEESLRHRRACDCGYNPFSEMPENKENCSVNLALKNHITFPSFQLMTDLRDPSMLYFRENNRRNLEPRRHWATLLDIYEVRSFPRLTCLTWNQFGEYVMAVFYPDYGEVPRTFDWLSLKPMTTLCILYPEKKTFLDMNQGIILENLDACFVFKAPLQQVQIEAQKLMRNTDIQTNQPLECFHCGIQSENLSQCSECKLAKYCSRVCLFLFYFNKEYFLSEEIESY